MGRNWLLTHSSMSLIEFELIIRNLLLLVTVPYINTSTTHLFTIRVLFGLSNLDEIGQACFFQQIMVHYF